MALGGLAGSRAVGQARRLKETGCQVRGEQAATGFRRSGCWGISVALAAAAPTPAGNCLTMMSWCSQPRLHLHDHYLESIPNAFISITLNSTKDALIKHSMCEKDPN